MAVTPPIESRLKILLPNTLPIAMSECLFQAAITEVMISGAAVPTATTVKPMIASEIPNNRNGNELLSSLKNNPYSLSITR